MDIVIAARCSRIEHPGTAATALGTPRDGRRTDAVTVARRRQIGENPTVADPYIDRAAGAAAAPPGSRGRTGTASPRPTAPTPPSQATPGAYIEAPLPPGSFVRGPVEAGDQGVSRTERAHAETAIRRLFEAPGVDMVAFYDQERGTYEIRSRTGFVRWQRWSTPTGELRYVVVARGGTDPIPSMDGTILRTLEQETAAAGGAGRPVPRELNSYPDVFQRISQLWDSRRAPDFVYIPTTGGDANHPGAGSHGIPDMVQSRAPLVVAGPGIAAGAVSHALVRHEDVAPTVAELLGVRPVIGTNASGVQRSQLLRWQDGRSLTGALSGAAAGARLQGIADRAVVFAVDGLSQPVLLDEIAAGRLPNIARIIARGTTFANGSLAGYPTVTWANHNTLVSGASPGHNGVVNNSWYDREQRREQLITDGGFRNSFGTKRLASPSVETLYEAVERSFPGAKTVAINQPAGRGADVSVLDLVGVPSLVAKLPKALPALLSSWLGRDRAVDTWKRYALQDMGASALAHAYFDSDAPPKLGILEYTQVDGRGHEAGPQSVSARQALREVDKEIGRVLDTLDRRGLTKSTAIVLTADHGMAHQDADVRRAGGWFDALKRAKSDGVVTKESTRFVYVKSLRVGIVGQAPRTGAAGILRLRVADDDADTRGVRPPIAGARVTVTDATGTVWTGATRPDGTLDVAIAATARGPLRVVVEHDEFSREQLAVALA